jgi:hypothetical protein
MMLRPSSDLFQITLPGSSARRAKIQPATIEKLRTKRVVCLTCGNKVCIGQCRFRKPHC